MNIKILRIILCIVNFGLASCDAYYVDLGKHYAWLVDDRSLVKIKDDLDNSLYYDIILRTQVLNCDNDAHFIVAYQVYDGSDYYDTKFFSKQKKDSLLRQFAEIKKIKYCYWIIDKETDQVIGPMRKQEFEAKCKELGVKAKMRKWQEMRYWK